MTVDEFAGDAPASTWSVGELAAATGLTVRTLHHYDEIGLARPSLRNHAGHRRYTPGDIRRLHRVAALRGFGFALSDIGGLLDGAPDAREVLGRQLDQVRDRIVRAERLRDRLTALLGMLDSATDPSAEMLVRLMEEMTAVEHTYTPEELEALAAHRRAMTAQLSEEQLAEMSARRQEAWDRMTPDERAALQRGRPGPAQPAG